MGLWFIATIYLDVRRCSALWYVFNRECSELLSIYWICPLIMKRSLTFAIWTLLYYGVEQPKKIGTFEILQHVLFLLQPGKCDETKVERKIHKKKQRLFLNHINDLIGVHFFWNVSVETKYYLKNVFGETKYFWNVSVEKKYFFNFFILSNKIFQKYFLQ